MTLRDWLDSNHMTARAFAVRAGVHENMIYRILSEKVRPSVPLAKCIEAATGAEVPWVDLVDRSASPGSAHGLVSAAVRSGRLTVPASCEACGRRVGRARDGRRGLHAHHHRGYERPLDVRWLCGRCHRKEHRVRAGEGKSSGAMVRVQKSTMDAARKLLSHILRHGWLSVGSDRTDAPTIGTVIDEASKRLLHGMDQDTATRPR